MRRPQRSRALALLLPILVVAALAATRASASDGDLDGSFHTTGTFHYGSPGSVDAARVVTAPDGALVVAGLYTSSAGTGFLHWRRVTDSGQDAACNVNPVGEEATSASGLGSALGVTFDHAGRLLLTAALRGSPQALVVARFLYPACTVDTGFAGDGYYVRTFDISVAGVGVAVQSTGKVVVAVQQFQLLGTNWQIVSLRLNDGGGLDLTYGDNGLATVPWPGDIAVLNDFALDAADRPIFAGALGQTPASLLAARMTADGAPDTSFDDDGVVVISVQRVAGGGAEALGLAVAADRSLALVGAVDDAGGKAPLVARLTAGGALDPGFDGDGIATPWSSPLSHDQRFASATFQGDGKLVAAGSWADPAVNPESVFVMRFGTNGAPDGSFGTFATTLVDFDLGGANADLARSVILAGGRIVVAGIADRDALLRDAFVLRLSNSQLFADGFEGANLAAWSVQP